MKKNETAWPAPKSLRSAIADLQQHYELLQQEYVYEKETYRLQSQKTGIHKKIQQGFCWYPLVVGRSYYNSLNQLVVEIERISDTEVEHNFEYGRPVCFFTSSASGTLQYLNFTGTVSFVENNRMLIVLPGNEALAQLHGIQAKGVQLYFDETSYKTMFAALQDVISAQGNRTAELREILSGNVPPQKRDLFPLHFPWLNDTQQKAVNEVLRAKDVAVVHGPPGTGKTTTLVEAVYETLHRENQVLVCAQSNTAVDWICEKLVDRGIHVLRIGNPTRVNDKMLSFTYERRFESHPDYPELWSIRKAIRGALTRKKNAGYSEKESLRNHLSRLRGRATEIEIRINDALFEDARVIGCTLVGAANKILNFKRFSTLFIDEAAQALEAACWIAINKADRVIFAGDHCQLPPTIKCPQAAKNGLERTLLQKIATRKPDVVFLLKIQYRMHEKIMNFSSRWFYNNELQSAPEVSNRGILAYDTPVVWYDTSACDFGESTLPDNQSRINKEEGLLLVGQLKDYIGKISLSRVLEENIDIGVISPYKAQVHYIRTLVRKDPFFKPFRKLITIHTVDGFQGQERDVIFISLVRSNDKGQIGFLHDLRRMNVAITRARMKLMILGNAETLSHYVFYKELYHYIEANGKVVQLQPENLQAAQDNPNLPKDS